jgi:hypothetical protein
MPTSIYHDLCAKKPDDKLTRDELACALYEGTPHLQNLAEKLASQHGEAEALTFFDMMGDDVQNFYKFLADALIAHATHWKKNEGSACVLDADEREHLKQFPRANPQP